MIDNQNGIQRTKRLGVVQLAIARNVEQRRWTNISGNILIGENHAFADRSLIKADGSLAQSFHIKDAQFLDLLAVDQRAKIKLGQRIRRRFHQHRIAEAQRPKYRQIHFQKLREELALNNEAHVGSAALLSIVKSLAKLFRQQGPIRELPDTVCIDPQI